MAGKRSAGISGSAVLVGTVALYLVYAGIRDVPFIEGLRSLLRREVPTSRESHSPYTVPKMASGIVPKGSGGGSDSGTDRLVGNAAAAYPVIRAMGSWKILGYGLRPDMSSDHPKGLAMDVMNVTEAEAQAIIARFKTLPGAKYWIWNRKIANVAVKNWTVRRYSGLSPHTDHIHLSFS